MRALAVNMRGSESHLLRHGLRAEVRAGWTASDIRKALGDDAGVDAVSAADLPAEWMAGQANLRIEAASQSVLVSSEFAREAGC